MSRGEGLASSSSASTAGPYIIDDRVARAMTLFGLSKVDVSRLWKAFKPRQRGGFLSVVDFFDMIKEPQTVVSLSLLKLVDVFESEKMDFGEFVTLVSTFCAFEKDDVVKFVWKVFDPEQKGVVPVEGLDRYFEALHNEAGGSQLKYALANFNFAKDGRFSFDDLCKMQRQFPVVLYPAYRFQMSMIATIGGETFWDRKKSALAHKRHLEAAASAKENRRHEINFERERQRKIRRHMGYLKYYVMPHKRRAYDVLYPRNSLEVKAKANAGATGVFPSLDDGAFTPVSPTHYSPQKLRAPLVTGTARVHFASSPMKRSHDRAFS